ncbi:MAG: DUF7003 family protein [Candidatus Sumerlaeaceae bacterium]
MDQKRGHATRVGLPDTTITTFASLLHNRDQPDNYVSEQAFEMYLTNNPNNEYRSISPIHEGTWQNPEDSEFVADNAKELLLRDHTVALPSASEYARFDIELEEAPRVQVFELCRYLGAVARQEVLASPTERRISVLPEMEQILQLEEWHHPNVVEEDQRPSGSVTFRQLAHVLATGDVELYQPLQVPNTHWQNWPEGGRL